MEDKYLWLEDVLGTEAIDWVKKNNHSVEKIKSHPWFNEIEKKALEIYESKEKVPYITIHGDYVYNLWNDDLHIQGIYRRIKIEDYLKADPTWETILDLDELSKKENTKYVFNYFELNSDQSRALVFLSPGGSDATIMREFDIGKKEFIVDGFVLPEAKGDAHWVDDNTIRVSRIFEEGSQTDAGYGRTIREWKRGEDLESAKIIFEVNKTDNSAYVKDVKTIDRTYYFLGRAIDFYNYEEMIFQNGKWVKLNLPTQFQDFKIVGKQYIVMLKVDWKHFSLGDILAYDLDTHECKKIFSINKNESIYEIQSSKSGLYLIIDEDVKGSLYKLTPDKNGIWTKVKLDIPSNGTIGSIDTDYQSDKFFVNYSSCNKPATYYYGEGERIICTAKVAPSFFNHDEIEIEQYFSTSLDGTKIPYFVIYKKGTKFDGKNPTILYGYGGFEVSVKPYFNNGQGSAWYSRGGVYVIANIRGGGEYGPSWHQAAIKEKRHFAYEDFYSVAEDLIARKITSPKHLGALGGSNGGLLMGVCYTQRPDLFAAIDCMVPLLDMHRYHKLLAGASWMAEYGNPDEDEGTYIKSISPYQNIKKDEKYPVIFLNTSTKDDRVHPGHARKFAAKISEYGHPFYYYENIVGGHGGASNLKDSAFMLALQMCFFWTHLSSD